MSIRQDFMIVLDQRGVSQLVTDMRAAGAKGSDALKQEFDRKMADLRHDLAAGIIDENEFKQAADRVSSAFNNEIIAKMDGLAKAGKGASAEYVELGKQLKAASDVGASSAGVVSQAWGKLKQFVTGLGGAIAAAFSVREIIAFGKASIAAANDNASAWARLGQSIGAVGGNFEKLRPQIEATLGKFGSKYIFDTDDLALSMAKLVPVTRSTAEALQATEVAAELARKGHMDLGSATDLLTRALATGRLTGLEPFVGQLDKTRPLLPQIAAGMGDVMQAMTPWEKLTASSAIAWNNLQEAIGRALQAGATGGTAFDGMIAAITELTKWIDNNKVEIAGWVTAVVGFVGTGLARVVALVRGTIRDIQGLWLFWTLLKNDALNAWDGLVVGIEQGQQVILNSLARLFDGIAKAQAFLGFKDAAAAMRANADDMRHSIAQLGADIGDRTQEMAARQRAEIQAVADFQRKAASESTEDVATSTDSMGASYHAFRGSAEDDLTNVTQTGKAKVGELSDATKAKMEEMSAAYDDASAHMQGSLLAGVDAVKAFHEEAAKAALISTATLRQANEEVASAYLEHDVPQFQQGSQAIQQELHAQRDAVEQVSEALHDGSRTYNADDVPAIQQGAGQVDRALDQNVKSAEGVTEAFRGGEQYYVGTAVPNILQGSGKLAAQQKADSEAAAKAAKGSADSTKTSWLDSFNTIGGAIGGLGNLFGGLFAGIGKGVNSAVGAIGSFISSFKTLAGAAGDFGKQLSGVLGMLGAGSTIGGMIGGKSGSIGGAVGGGIGTIIGGPVGGVVGSVIGGAIGSLFHRDKNPERLRTNQAEFTKAAQGDQAALDHLYALSGRLAAGTGWATDAARDDAYEAYLKALQLNPALHSSGSNTANLRNSGPVAAPTAVSVGTPTAFARPTALKGFALGGLVPETGVYGLHADELVLPPDLTRQLSMLLSVPPRPMMTGGASTTDNRALNIHVELHGVADQAVPQRVVDVITQRLGEGYQQSAALSGNVRLPL